MPPGSWSGCGSGGADDARFRNAGDRPGVTLRQAIEHAALPSENAVGGNDGVRPGVRTWAR